MYGLAKNKELAYAVSVTNFENPTDEQKRYFIDYVGEFQLETDDYNPQATIATLTDIFSNLRVKICIQKFSFGDQENAYDMAYRLIDLMSKIWKKDQFKSHMEPLHREFLMFMMSSLSVGPRPKHIKLWKNLFPYSFEDYLKKCPSDEWKKILDEFKKDYFPLQYEDQDTFYDDLDDGFSLFINVKTPTDVHDELSEYYGELYLHMETAYINRMDQEYKYRHHMASTCSNKYDRSSIFKCIKDENFYKRCFKILVKVLSDPNFPENKNKFDRIRTINSKIFDSLKGHQIFEGLCGESLDYVFELTCKETGPAVHELVDTVGHYYRYVNVDQIKDKVTVFNTMSSKLAEFLENLEDHSYCDLELVESLFVKILLKCMNKTKEHQSIFIRLLLLAVNIPTCIKALRSTFREMEGKVIKWQDFKESAMEFFLTMKEIRMDEATFIDSKKRKEACDELSSVVEYFLKEMKKYKLTMMLIPDIADYILDIIEERATNIFKCCQEAYKFMDGTNLKSHRTAIFDTFSRLTSIMKYENYPWYPYYSYRSLAYLTRYCIEGLEKGKNLDDTELMILSNFLVADMQGDMIDPEENRPGRLHYETLVHTTTLFEILGNKGYLTTDKRIIPLLMDLLEHEEEQIKSFAYRVITDISRHKGVSALAPHFGRILKNYMENPHHNLVHALSPLYKLNKEPMRDYFQQMVDLLETTEANIKMGTYNILKEVAELQPQLFTHESVDKIFKYTYEGETNDRYTGLHIIQALASKRVALVVKHLDRLINEPIAEHTEYQTMKILGFIAVKSKKEVAERVMEFLLKFLKETSDPTKKMYSVMEFRGMAYTHREMVLTYKSQILAIGKATSDGTLKEMIQNVIDILEGRSLGSLAEEFESQREDIDMLDVRVTKNEKNIKDVKIEVINQKKDIKNIKKDVKGQGKKLNELGEVVEDTVKRVEEIDQKTLSHAPYWSKDVSKLLNPKSDTDWRLLSSRLGYSKDDIRAWAQQADPCMALLNEWYTTHKTSEANSGVLTALQEMNRMDAALFIENGMKAAEQVVEDEEFEYSSPPPIFLSYQWGHQEEVKLLRQHLEMAGYSCWMDIGQMGGGDKLFEKIDKGIRSAKIIISCTTEKYAKSPNCNREVNLSVNLKKPIIPLLLEDCPWPPEGSMGPIFSEYLYIQFFQRDKSEATTDDRFWPIPKFQELLMQLSMNGIAPDEYKVYKLYRNWWKPLVEEIKIEKSKTFGGGKKQKQIQAKEVQKDKKSPEIFISYQWDKQKNVMLLYKRLTELGYHCWMDIHQMGGGDSLYDKIDRGIRGCQVVLSCVTEKYSLSANCRREVSLCDSLKRPIIPLLLENMTWPPRGPMSMAFTELLYIDFHSDKELQEKWTGQKFDEMRSKIKQIVPELEIELSSNETSSAEVIQKTDKTSEVETKSIKKEKSTEKTKMKIEQPSKPSPSEATNGNSTIPIGGKQSDTSAEHKTSNKTVEPSQSVNQELPSSNDLYQQEVHHSNIDDQLLVHQSAHVPNSYHIQPEQVHQPPPGQYHHPQQYPQQQYPQQPQQYYQPQQYHHPQQYHQPQQYNQQPQYTHQQPPQPNPSKSSTCSIL